MATVHITMELAIEYMKRRFRANPDSAHRPKLIRRIMFDGDTGIPTEYIEIQYEGADPTPRRPDTYDLQLRTKPPIKDPPKRRPRRR